MSTEFVCVDINGNLCITKSKSVAEKFIEKFSSNGSYALIKYSSPNEGCVEATLLNEPCFSVDHQVREIIKNKVWSIIKGIVKRENANVPLLTPENYEEAAQLLTA